MLSYLDHVMTLQARIRTPTVLEDGLRLQMTQTNYLTGGSNGRGKILDITRGHFETGFSGCIRNVIVQNIEVFAHVEDITGKNIRSCEGEN